MKYCITFFLVLMQMWVFSQDNEQLKKQFEFAQKSENWFEGYSKTVGGNDFSYPSLRNDITECLLCRCTHEEMAIAWETQVVPENYKGATVSFVWIAALDLTDNSDRFDVYVNDEKKFVVTSGLQTDWKIENSEGGSMEYMTIFKDQHGDAHGYMTMTVPRKWITPGQGLRIKIVGEKKGENTWIIVYKADDVIDYLSNAAQHEAWMDVYCEYAHGDCVMTIEAPAFWAGKVIECDLGGEKRILTLLDRDSVAGCDVRVPKPDGWKLVIRDEKNKLVDIDDIRVDGERQIIFAQSLLMLDVKNNEGRAQIHSRRIYCPKTVESMLALSRSKLAEGTVSLMNSSHQDIAWMDSPEKCIIERDTMLITPLLDAAQRNKAYKFDIEDALMIKEYIERHPEREEVIRQMLLSGKISCGATYTQPYEEMYSGEALARQFYFGKKWLSDRFGYNANVYWNVDVPGRTPQMPQIMKKAEVDYLVISRHERGIFRWFSPDDASVMVFSPGHYADAFAAMNKNFFEAAEYVASSSMDWEKYYDKGGREAVIPLLSDWDMSPAKDYSGLIKQWESVNKIEVTPGEALEVHLPEINIVTAPDFMRDFELGADNIPEIRGERPAVWLYIHGPGHQKAIKSSREGDILLTAAEKFATMEALAKNSFADYPQQRLTDAWEAKIFPDHGWGGKQGVITDDYFRRKYEFARNEGRQIIENATRSLAGYVKARTKNGIPLVVFNSLSWERNDVVRCVVSFDKGVANSFVLRDAGKRVIAHQQQDAEYYEDGTIKEVEICFVASQMPSMGYATFYVEPEKTSSAVVPVVLNDVYENDYYRIRLADGGISSIFDKELGLEIIDSTRFKAGEVFTMQSEGHGAGEFDNVQAPGMEGFDKTGDYTTQWELIYNGPVYTAFKIRQPIRNAVVEEVVTIYNTIKKIDFDVALLNWDGVLFREYRMAMPLNMHTGEVAYEVPYGVSEVGKDEIEGAAGERYLARAVDIHPRGIENWIGASDDQLGVTLSSSVVAADYIDPTDPASTSVILQPILLASRVSCHPEGNQYRQTGNHHFSFSLRSHQPGWKHGFRFGKEANEKLFVVVNPEQYKKAYLPQRKSFFSVDGDNVVVSAMKKSEDDNGVVLRMYDIGGEDSDVEMKLNFKPMKCYHTTLIEKNKDELRCQRNVIRAKIGKHSIETFKVMP